MVSLFAMTTTSGTSVCSRCISSTSARFMRCGGMKKRHRWTSPFHSFFSSSSGMSSRLATSCARCTEIRRSTSATTLSALERPGVSTSKSPYPGVSISVTSSPCRAPSYSGISLISRSTTSVVCPPPPPPSLSLSKLDRRSSDVRRASLALRSPCSSITWRPSSAATSSSSSASRRPRSSLIREASTPISERSAPTACSCVRFASFRSSRVWRASPRFALRSVRSSRRASARTSSHWAWPDSCSFRAMTSSSDCTMSAWAATRRRTSCSFVGSR
mmetsp:Transcript_17221/g.55581  ORF Transcript_17221/g.55581 Transcript_17221/m.55581 type:complete len:274 (+) Transcript_17221:840-1661(+)